ncbi:hypothetical protein, partial [Streptomyces californicus]
AKIVKLAEQGMNFADYITLLKRDDVWRATAAGMFPADRCPGPLLLADEMGCDGPDHASCRLLGQSKIRSG